MLKSSLHLGQRIFVAFNHSKYCGVRKYIFIRTFLEPINKSFTQISRLRIWCPSRIGVFTTIRLKDEVNFFIKKSFWKSYFLSAFIVLIESF